MTLPTIINICLDELVDQINIRHAGHLQNEYMIAGLGQAWSLMIMLPYSITNGVSGVLETLVSQAYGSNNYKLCGQYLNK